MLNRLLKAYQNSNHATDDAEEVRQKLQTIFFKIKTYQNHLQEDNKLNFKIVDTSKTAADSTISGQITFFLGGYALRFEHDDIKSIQLFRRGQVDSLQYAELLAISFFNRVEYIADRLFVKSDLFQLEILINHVVKSRNQKITL